MNRMNTPLSRVRGLGSAKQGAHHWWLQRVTAAGNILLVGWFFLSLLLLPNLSHEVSISLREAAEGATREVALSVDGQTDRIHFRIPKGVTDGQKIRLRGQGQPGPGGRTVTVEPDTVASTGKSAPVCRS